MPNPSQLTRPPIVLQGVNPPGYSAQDLRLLAAAGRQLQEGAIAAGDFKVSQRAAGAGLAVDVALGEAFVQGDSVVYQGLYYVLQTTALTGAAEVTVPAGDATNPRIDQLVLEVKDTAHDGSGLNVARVRLVQGTPTSGATLDNRLGAATLPPNALRLADLLMPAGSVQATNANIRDRRTWARGAHLGAVTAGGAFVTSLATFALIGAFFTRRIECSGAPLHVRLRAVAMTAGVDGRSAEFRVNQDGAYLDPSTYKVRVHDGGTFAIFHSIFLDLLIPAPTPGSHLFEWYWRSTGVGKSVEIGNDPAEATQVELEETLRQNVGN